MNVLARGGSIRLEAGTDFKALSLVTDEDVTVPPGPWEVAADGEHVFIRPADLVQLAGAMADNSDWRAGFDAMVAYAISKGWSNDDGMVRMHIVRSTDTGRRR